MNKKNLGGLRVAILATDGVEQSELLQPQGALLEAGADVKVIAPSTGNIKGWQDGDWGLNIHVDSILGELQPEEFDALVVPGGALNTDQLRQETDAVNFVRQFIDSGKPVAAICHGLQLLIDADVVRGRTLTSAHAIRNDLVNAGANWVDQAAVVDNGLVTSRNPGDLAPFISRMKEEFAEGRHRKKKTKAA